MLLLVLYYIFLGALLLGTGYAVCKGILHFGKLRHLWRLLGRAQKENPDLRITVKRRLIGIPFGKYGDPFLEFEIAKKRYELTVLSFPSVRSRWNLELGSSLSFIEVRRKNRLFYGIEKNSEEPDSAVEYRRELRLLRRPIRLTEQDPAFTEQLILVYPEPRELTVTAQRQEYIAFGSTVNGHTVISLTGLCEIMGIKE